MSNQQKQHQPSGNIVNSHNNKTSTTNNKNNKKNQQAKYQKPTQPIYRPPSARIEPGSTPTTMTLPTSSSGQVDLSSFHLLSSAYNSSTSSNNNQYSLHHHHNHNHHHPSDVFLIKQHSPGSSGSMFGNVISNVFPIRGVLKRSKSFGNNQNNNNSGQTSNSGLKSCDKSKKKQPQYHFLDETAAGTFFLSLENVSRDNVQLIKQALNRETCASVTMHQLLQIIRILCNKVLEKPINANVVAKVCLEIHHNQQMSMIRLSDHKYLFLESLANCLREWFNERDKLRFTTGGARRWTAYILFLMEIYVNLKETVLKDMEINKYYLISDDSSEEDEDEDVEDDLDDNLVSRSTNTTFESSSATTMANTSNTDNSNSSSGGNNNNNESSANDSSQADSSSCKSGSSERYSLKKTSSANSIEAKIMCSLLTKQQKQFAHLLLDSFQVILSNPNSTPAEIECMQTVFRKCGKYLDEDNPSRIKSMIFIIRDILLNYSNANQFINANNNSSQNSSISKSLLEIIELASSGWRFNQSQQIYYFPYTKID